MKDLSNVEPASQGHLVLKRFLWFLAGAGVNYLLIATPLKYLRTHLEVPLWAAVPCSMAVSATFFFLWNYFINFRTDSRKRDALRRYLIAVVLMWMLSSGLLLGLKHVDAGKAFSVGKFALDLDIVATQFFLSWLKFILYHKWVFPLPKAAIPARKPAESDVRT